MIDPVALQGVEIGAISELDEQRLEGVRAKGEARLTRRDVLRNLHWTAATLDDALRGAAGRVVAHEVHGNEVRIEAEIPERYLERYREHLW